jgi:hypothetical protein
LLTILAYFNLNLPGSDRYSTPQPDRAVKTPLKIELGNGHETP